mmetsp:Transcript_12464/g.36747  ORF Transcript_12464/g.36747 Transcript_12464/m.36747 type:complete len:207 (+) Transcript_12464:1073-1693(+)
MEDDEAKGDDSPVSPRSCFLPAFVSRNFRSFFHLRRSMRSRTEYTFPPPEEVLEEKEALWTAIPSMDSGSSRKFRSLLSPLGSFRKSCKDCSKLIKLPKLFRPPNDIRRSFLLSPSPLLLAAYRVDRAMLDWRFVLFPSSAASGYCTFKSDECKADRTALDLRFVHAPRSERRASSVFFSSPLSASDAFFSPPALEALAARLDHSA